MSTRGLIACAVAIGLVAATTATVGAKGKGRADSGTIYAATTHTVGNTQYVAGDYTDKVLGGGAVTFRNTVSGGTTPGTFKGSGPVTVFTKTGSLQGSTSETVIVNPDGSATFSNGTVKLTKGSGGQKGHSFIGTFTGTAKTAAGPYTFNFKGTYH